MINNQNLAVLSEKVAYLEAAIKNAGIELPSVTTDDNGKTLQVVAGKWDKGMIIPELPAVTAGDNGKALQVANGAWATGGTIPSTTEVIFTNTEIASNVVKSIGKMDKLVGGSIKVTVTASASEWTTIGTLSVAPTETINVPIVKSSDGSYGGMADISNQGLVRIYPNSAITNSSVALTFAFRTS